MAYFAGQHKTASLCRLKKHKTCQDDLRKVERRFQYCVCRHNYVISNVYTMDCLPVRGDNPRALASGLS